MGLNSELIQKLDLKEPSVWFATWFGFGLMSKAPGTWGTLGGLPFALAFLYWGGWPSLLFAAMTVFILGLWSAKKFEEMTGEHDSGAIVIDEVVGICLALLTATISLWSVFLAFVLFRFLDILKPWPVSWADQKLPGSWGVMMDDVLAGLFAAIILGGLRYAGFG